MSIPLPPLKLRQALLGLFIVGQVGFLTISSIVDLYFPDSQAQASLRSWGRLSGQTQQWRLFAEVDTHSLFNVVEFRWPDGSILQVPSSFEPPSSLNYRLPGPGDRLFNYEKRVGSFLYVPWEEEDLPRQGPQFQEARREVLRRHWRPALVYLRWTWAEFQKEHPTRSEPREVILLLHIYDTPAPGEQPTEGRVPKARPLVRWRPATAAEGSLPLEVYDPVRKEFLPVPDPGPPPGGG